MIFTICHSIHQVWAVWDHSFWVMLRINKQTEDTERPTHADNTNVRGNYTNITHLGEYCVTGQCVEWDAKLCTHWPINNNCKFLPSDCVLVMLWLVPGRDLVTLQRWQSVCVQRRRSIAICYLDSTVLAQLSESTMGVFDLCSLLPSQHPRTWLSPVYHNKSIIMFVWV